MKIAIIINSERLTEELKTKLTSNELSDQYQIDFDTYFPLAKNLEQTMLEVKKKSYQAYLVGGGDGTVRQAAHTLGSDEIPLAILPLGSFNLLAKSLQLSNDIDKTFAMIKNNKTKLIDLISVNDVTIINHAWIGFYFYILKLRKKHKQLLGKNRLLKSIFNMVTLFKYLPIYTLEMIVDKKMISYQACLIYVGNNEFYTSLFDVGKRETLSSGLMSITILSAKNRWQLFLSMLDLIFGNIKNSKYITYFRAEKFSITSESNQINMVIDGELFKLATPLHFRNDQKKLKVIIP